MLLPDVLLQVAPGAEKTIGPHAFSNWGAHHNSYPCAYFTTAAAYGTKKEEVDVFVKKLDKTFTKINLRGEKCTHRR